MNILRGFTLLLVLQLAGEIVVRLFGLNMPGPVVGLGLLLAGLLAWRPLERHIAPAADTLLAHLSLLFIPAGVGVVVHVGRLDGLIPSVGATLIGSTVIGLVVTAVVLQTLLRRSGVTPTERPDGADRATEGDRRG